MADPSQGYLGGTDPTLSPQLCWEPQDLVLPLLLFNIFMNLLGPPLMKDAMAVDALSWCLEVLGLNESWPN